MREVRTCQKDVKGEGCLFLIRQEVKRLVVVDCPDAETTIIEECEFGLHWQETHLDALSKG